jgi:glyoxylate/hydroxypyruvate reductase A
VGSIFQGTSPTSGVGHSTPRPLLKAWSGKASTFEARSVLDDAALCTALAGGRLSGAILDVFDPEPLPPDSPLWDTPNVIITPHCSSDDAQAYVPKTLDLIFENLRRLLTGEDLVAAIDPRLGY